MTKYILKDLLKEIEQDEKAAEKEVRRKLSQSEIRKILSSLSKKEEPDEKR
ncbi:MAG: hypothetical protein H6681_02010 [Desulfobacteraceae bacterium]|nr:hypothetical protein [Desulfobacteraceae bacterium]MCB9494202.1 hypothetical protein [Desulfobacteraceae bacterium]